MRETKKSLQEKLALFHKERVVGIVKDAIHLAGDEFLGYPTVEFILQKLKQKYQSALLALEEKPVVKVRQKDLLDEIKELS